MYTIRKSRTEKWCTTGCRKEFIHNVVSCTTYSHFWSHDRIFWKQFGGLFPGNECLWTSCQSILGEININFYRLQKSGSMEEKLTSLRHVRTAFKKKPEIECLCPVFSILNISRHSSRCREYWINFKPEENLQHLLRLKWNARVSWTDETSVINIVLHEHMFCPQFPQSLSSTVHLSHTEKLSSASYKMKNGQ